MKTVLYLLLSASLLFGACKKDDDCNETNLSNAIVGEWNVVVLVTIGSVEFKANGELVDDGGVFIQEQIGGVTVNEKRYEVESNSRINIIAETSSGNFEYAVDVTDFDCDEIDIDVPSLSISGKLRRKE